jgi:hypothetical protein
MKNNIRLYGQEFNPSVIKDVKEINEKINKETNSEEILKLRLQRLYRGMELNTSIYQRNYRSYFPY